MDGTIDSLGRILIPKKIRTRLGLGPNTKVNLQVDDDTLQIKKKEAGKVWLERQKSGVLVIRGAEPVGDVVELIRQSREERMEQIIGRVKPR